MQSELPTVEELVEHGVSQNLLDFVSQLTVETFVAFPGEDMNHQELKMYPTPHLTQPAVLGGRGLDEFS